MGHTSATNGGPSRLDGHAPPVSGPIGGALTPLCLRSLVDSYDHGRQLFSHQLFDGVWREVDDLYPHETLTSSCIALLGLARRNRALGRESGLRWSCRSTRFARRFSLALFDHR